MLPKKTLDPADVTVKIDTREQLPLVIDEMKSVRGTLSTGDYSVVGLEEVIAIERKSLPDLVMCVGRERDRFERECARLVEFPVRAIIVEASWADLEKGDWRGQLKPAHVLGSVLGWICQGIPIMLLGDRERASKYVQRLLFIAARRKFRDGKYFPFAETMTA